MTKFKKGDLVFPSQRCRACYVEQVFGVKSGKVIGSVYDGTKGNGHFPYMIQWDSGLIEAYQQIDLKSEIKLENK